MPPHEGIDKNIRLSTEFSGFKKYPTNRDHPLKSPMKWMDGRRKDDNIKGPYWRIHDKLYDFSEFMNRHPGGKAWLEFTKGADITEAFETSHMSTMPETLLKKFYVKDAEGPRNSPYTFHENGFFKTFLRKVRPIFEKVGTGPSLSILILQDGIALTFMLLAVCAAIYQSFSVAIAAGIALAWTIMCAHNFFHQKDNWRMYYYDLTFLTSQEWRISHGFSHHMYTNTIYDIEISQLEPYWELLPKAGKSVFQRYCFLFYEYLIMPTILFLEGIKKIFFLLTGEATFSIPNLFPYIQLAVMVAYSPSLIDGLKLWATVHATCSVYFNTVGAIVAHHHPDIYREGDRFRDDPDWGLCQLDAVRDRKEVNDSLILSATTFGHHSLHHLLPTVDHSKLHYCYDALFETCKEFDYPFHYISQWELLKGKYMCLANTQPNQNLPGFKRKAA